MTLVTLSMLVVGQAASLLMDWLIVLILVRALATRCRAGILVELDTAGRPLVDRTLAWVARIWDRLVPDRSLRPRAVLFVASLALCVARLVAAALLGWLATAA